MKITKEVLTQIEKIANSKDVEIGGILGFGENEIVSYVIADLPDDSVGCRFDYYPNITFLNEQIEKWAEQGIDFAGFFHTHFSGSQNLSDTDKVYINAIMISSKDIVDCLFFPVFTLPDNKLNVYRASFQGEEIIIDKDELDIV